MSQEMYLFLLGAMILATFLIVYRKKEVKNDKIKQ
jgi:hypothetical protein